jgi:tetratricopeptide (TPR) repeat protein
MELRRLGQLEQARQSFARLLSEHPDYVPTYLMAGNLWLALGDPAGARDIFDRGIEVAGRLGQEHALSELMAARAGAV